MNPKIQNLQKQNDAIYSSLVSKNVLFTRHVISDETKILEILTEENKELKELSKKNRPQVVETKNEPKANEPKDKGLKVVRQTQGRFVFQRPGRFIWDTQKPYEQKLIADGKRLILWDKDLNQATIRPAGQALAATPAAILFGESSLDQHFDLVESEERLGMKWVALSPKKDPNTKSGTDLPYTKISVGMANGLPKALELTDGLGSVVLVTLDKIRLNVNLPANRFTFTPPAGAEVLRLN
jgi:outer membrane lipoprotein carrier protein